MKPGFRMGVTRMKVVFDFSCCYTLPASDQLDTNKLFGVGFVEWWRLVWLWITWPVFALLSRDRHHKDSARVGWYYDPDKKKIVVVAYCYIGGTRTVVPVCDISINRPYLIELTRTPGAYEIKVMAYEAPYMVLGMVVIPAKHNKRFTYPLGLYFGGNNPAPHTMTIEMKRV